MYVGDLTFRRKEEGPNKCRLSRKVSRKREYDTISKKELTPLWASYLPAYIWLRETKFRTTAVELYRCLAMWVFNNKPREFFSPRSRSQIWLRYAHLWDGISDLHTVIRLDDPCIDASPSWCSASGLREVYRHVAMLGLSMLVSYELDLYTNPSFYPHSPHNAEFVISWHFAIWCHLWS